jgi:hypothetical protein
MNEHKPWCCDGYAAFCPLCPRPTELVRCLGHAYTDRNRETVRISQLHARHAHPDFEYRITNGPRKQWDASDVPPTDEDGIPERGWERNVDRGDNGWERFDYHEEAYWRRPKRKTGDPCARPECGGELHTDPWGVPVQCPHAAPVATDTGRRCPRCDCPDGHEQCDHCKVCPHGRPTEATEFASAVGCAVLHRDAQGNVIPCPDQQPVPHTQEQPMKPHASVVELIAPGTRPEEDGGGSIVVPREVHINGVSVLTAGDIRVNPVRPNSDLVTVNVTLVVRRLVIAADGDTDSAEAP